MIRSMMLFLFIFVSAGIPATPAAALSNSTNLEFEINHVPLNSSIVNRHDFKFLLNPDASFCKPTASSEQLLVLVYVHSAPENLKRRISIRETWAKQSYFKANMRIVFMLGVNTNSFSKTQKLLEFENSIYGDLVQEDFEDSYKVSCDFEL